MRKTLQLEGVVKMPFQNTIKFRLSPGLDAVNKPLDSHGDHDDYEPDDEYENQSEQTEACIVWTANFLEEKLISVLGNKIFIETLFFEKLAYLD
jgi:hypothetical protein